MTSLSKGELIAIGSTAVLGVAAFAVGVYSVAHLQPLGVAIGIGALGGLVHEMAQSRGRIWFFKRYDDGFYVGNIAGMVLGIVAGLLVTRGYLAQTPTDMSALGYEVFFASLGLKGVVEAAGGSPPTLSGAATGSAQLSEKLPNRPPTALR